MSRITSGKHFGALLSCPQKAWLEYHGDASLAMAPPAFLRSLQQEGLELEQDIYAAHYRDAMTIPERLPIEERAARTLEAMRSGAGAILQGLLLGDDAVGIVDILEYVGSAPDSPTGHRYRVGEIKRAKVLATAHVFQALWYDEFLSRQQRGSVGDVFFLLGDEQRHVVPVTDAWATFHECKQALWALRDSMVEPGPHLCRDCRTCRWRGVCMPALEVSAHLSLLPHLGRSQAEQLRAAGLTTWREVHGHPADAWTSLPIESREAGQLRRAARQLDAGAAVLRFPVKAAALQGWTVVTFDFPVSSTSERRAYTEPTALWHEEASGPRQIDLAHGSTTNIAQELAALLADRSLAVYGAGDAIALQQLATQIGLDRRPRCTNIVDFLEEVVHAPFIGLELRHVLERFQPSPPESLHGSYRIKAIRGVLQWIAGATAL